MEDTNNLVKEAESKGTTDEIAKIEEVETVVPDKVDDVRPDVSSPKVFVLSQIRSM